MRNRNSLTPFQINNSMLLWRLLNDSLRSVNIAICDLSYHDLETPLTGQFCWNDGQQGPRPGILLIHGGAGLDAHAREQACRYAALGYAVLACDMFGDGIAGDKERVMACLLALRDDPDLLIRRGRAGLAALAGCHWQLVMYGRALHGFTHRPAVPGAMPGVAYDRLADERSFAAARAFLAEALAP